ncbi:MAG: hypothetical protein J6W88_05175 [Bacteroidales bacterium]|nr:hypothetical protein [Bacteroidales bacterium]
MNKKKFYEAPDTIVVSFKTERGFANSGQQVDPDYKIGSLIYGNETEGNYVERESYSSAGEPTTW